MKVSGFAEIEKELLKLSDARGTKILRASMLAAAKPIAAQARANAAAIAKGSGALSLSIAVGGFSVKNRLDVGAWLGALVPAMGATFNVSVGPKSKHPTAVALYNIFYKRKRKRKGIYHGGFIEFKHLSKSGSTVAAKPFLEPALRSRSSEAVTIFADRMRQGIARALRPKPVKK